MVVRILLGLVYCALLHRHQISIGARPSLSQLDAPESSGRNCYEPGKYRLFVVTGAALLAGFGSAFRILPGTRSAK